MASKRQDYLDGVAGIMILYMLYSHICCWVPEIKINETVTRVLFLFMSWFFFKSGMFYKRSSIKETIFRGWRSLLVPFLFFSLIGEFVFALKYWLNDGSDWISYFVNSAKVVYHQGAFAGNAPLWFLLTLFVVKLMFNFISGISEKRIFIYVVSVSSFLLAYMLNLIGFSDNYYIANMLLGLSFYCMGYILVNIQYRRIVFFLSSVAFFCLIIFIPTYLDFRSNTISANGNYIAWGLACVCGVIMLNNIFKYLYSYSKIISAFVYIGRHSMAYYIMHWIVLGVTQIILCDICGAKNSNIIFLCYCLVVLSLCPILEKILINSRYSFLLGIKKN